MPPPLLSFGPGYLPKRGSRTPYILFFSSRPRSRTPSFQSPSIFGFFTHMSLVTSSAGQRHRRPPPGGRSSGAKWPIGTPPIWLLGRRMASQTIASLRHVPLALLSSLLILILDAVEIFVSPEFYAIVIVGGKETV